MKDYIHNIYLVLFLLTPIFVFGQVDTIADNIYEFEGNLGIGTNMPESGLNIEYDVPTGVDRGILKLRNTNTGNRASVHAAFQANDKSSQSAIGHTSQQYTGIPDFDEMGYIASNASGFSIYSSSNYGSLRFYTNENANGIIERMRINAQGNVGIGTSTSEIKLRIEDNVPTGADRGILKLRNTSTGNRASVHMAFEANDKSSQSAIGHTSQQYTGIPDFDEMGYIASNASGFSIYSSSNYGSLRFYTNQDGNGIIERMRINASGNIGIGTKTPMFPLHLAKLESEEDDNILFIQHGNNGSKLAQTKEGGELELLAEDGSDVVFSSYNDSYLNVENGNFGIGTNSPTAKLEVTSGDIYLSDINKGIIMKSPDGACWRGKLDNNGQLGFKVVQCPETLDQIASSGNK